MDGSYFTKLNKEERKLARSGFSTSTLGSRSPMPSQQTVCTDLPSLQMPRVSTLSERLQEPRGLARLRTIMFCVDLLTVTGKFFALKREIGFDSLRADSTWALWFTEIPWSWKTSGQISISR